MEPIKSQRRYNRRFEVQTLTIRMIFIATESQSRAPQTLAMKIIVSSHIFRVSGPDHFPFYK